jgi:hypothetical protein
MEPVMPVEWTNEKCALLGYSIGRGVPIDQVAYMLNTTTSSVNSQAAKLNISTNTRPYIILPPGTKSVFLKAAQSRQITLDELLARIHTILGTDIHLLDNVLDDGVNTC